MCCYGEHAKQADSALIKKNQNLCENIISHKYVSPNSCGGRGRKHTPLSENRDYSGTKCTIDLKPGCKVKFVRCLETYLKELIILGHGGTLLGPFLQTVLRN